MADFYTYLEFRLFCIFGFYLAKSSKKRILWCVLRQFRQLTQYEIRNKAEKTGKKKIVFSLSSKLTKLL